MSLYVELLLVFVSIGLFCFGGGYVIIPLIQEEIVSRGWMTVEEFINIIAVSESTPGPLSINTATYVGFKLLGLPGAAIATFGLMLPAFILVVLVSKIWATERGKQFFQRIMVGIRPIVAGLVFAAAISIAKTVLVQSNPTGAYSVSYIGFLLAVVAYVAIRRFSVHPIILIGGAAILGAVFS